MSKKSTASALLDRHGQTYAEELDIDLDDPTPSPLFRLLVASQLFSARIDAGIAAEAARNLSKRGWRTAGKMRESSWEDRVSALNDAGYTRYQERTATMLGDVAELVEERWSGDLRKLRDEADRDPDAERELLKEAKGVGDVGVDIFFREVQVAWPEIAPFADDRALKAARELDLAGDPGELEKLADGRAEYARLVAALVRTQLAGDHDEIRAAA